MALQKFKRHTAKCCDAKKIKRDNRSYVKCRCPWQVEGTLAIDGFVRKSTGESDAEKADEKMRLWSEAGTLNPPPGFKVQLDGGRIIQSKERGKSVTEAVKLFLSDIEGRGWESSTRRKFATILTDRLLPYCEGKGVNLVADIKPDTLVEFRMGWTYSPLSAQKHIERLRNFFKFCVDMDWIQKSPCKLTVKVEHSQKDPFTVEQVDAIMDTLHEMEDGDDVDGRWVKGIARVRAFIYVMLYGGLAVSDATKLGVSDLIGNALVFRRRKTKKTGGDVWVPLPDGSDERPDVAGYLRALKPESENYFFWSGRGAIDTAVTNWSTRLMGIFKRAGIEGCHTHRFRHTFAAWNLQRGVPIESVSKLLGHSSVKITERSYAKWSKGRQDLLNEQVREAWSTEKVKPINSHRKRA